MSLIELFSLWVKADTRFVVADQFGNPRFTDWDCELNTGDCCLTIAQVNEIERITGYDRFVILVELLKTGNWPKSEDC